MAVGVLILHFVVVPQLLLEKFKTVLLSAFVWHVGIRFSLNLLLLKLILAFFSFFHAVKKLI